MCDPKRSAENPDWFAVEFHILKLINQFLICIPFTLCNNEFMRAMLLIVAHEHAVGSGGQLGLPFC
jgi:putative AlgH/UPF0301 family transcriptional regulator